MVPMNPIQSNQTLHPTFTIGNANDAQVFSRGLSQLGVTQANLAKFKKRYG
jgi:hypothetical protein